MCYYKKRNRHSACSIPTMVRSIFLFVCLALAAPLEAREDRGSDVVHETEYFSFHNQMWMNLHHFFYELASNDQRKKLQEDGLSFNNIGDSLRIARLTPAERELLDAGVAFYAEKVIDQQLLNSGRIFKWLQAQPTDRDISDTTFSEAFTATLNRLRPLYASRFWPAHQAENNRLIGMHIDRIRQTENEVIARMEVLSGAAWTGKVRVDVTTYGNWAGAYSPALDNIVVSSIDPMMVSSVFIEFVFHESSHLLFSRKSPFRMAIFLKSRELDIPLPRQLWHAAMFYVSGLAVSEALEGLGISHQPIMQAKNVFPEYYKNRVFKSVLEAYYRSEIDREEMAARLLRLDS